jgi:hypothetical protein
LDYSYYKLTNKIFTNQKSKEKSMEDDYFSQIRGSVDKPSLSGSKFTTIPSIQGILLEVATTPISGSGYSFLSDSITVYSSEIGITINNIKSSKDENLKKLFVDFEDDSIQFTGKSALVVPKLAYNGKIGVKNDRKLVLEDSTPFYIGNKQCVDYGCKGGGKLLIGSFVSVNGVRMEDSEKEQGSFNPLYHIKCDSVGMEDAPMKVLGELPPYYVCNQGDSMSASWKYLMESVYSRNQKIPVYINIQYESIIFPLFIPSSNIMHVIGDLDICSISTFAEFGARKVNEKFPTLLITSFENKSKESVDGKEIETIKNAIKGKIVVTEYGTYRNGEGLDEPAKYITDMSIFIGENFRFQNKNKSVKTGISGVNYFLFIRNMNDFKAISVINHPDLIVFGQNAPKNDKGPKPSELLNSDYKWKITRDTTIWHKSLISNFTGYLEQWGLLVSNDFGYRIIGHMLNDIFILTQGGGGEINEGLLSFKAFGNDPLKTIRSDEIKSYESNPLNQHPNMSVRNLKEASPVNLKEYLSKSNIMVLNLLGYTGTLTKNFYNEISKKIVNDLSIVDILNDNRNKVKPESVIMMNNELLIICIYLSIFEKSKKYYKTTQQENLEAIYSLYSKEIQRISKERSIDIKFDILDNKTKSTFSSILESFTFVPFSMKKASQIKKAQRSEPPMAPIKEKKVETQPEIQIETKVETKPKKKSETKK